MRSRIVLVSIALGVAFASAAAALSIGDEIPSAGVKMKNVDGRMLSIADVKGPKGTLVLFSCNSCPWVQAWEPRIAELGNTYRQEGVGVIQINPNDPSVRAEDSYAGMQQRAEERGFEFPYVVDATSDVARAFGASHTPEAFLFDGGGKLVYHGTIDDDAHNPDKVEKHYLRDALAAVVAGTEVPVKETKALGCSIKFR